MQLKTMFSALVVSVLAFALTGCGEGAAGGTDDETINIRIAHVALEITPIAQAMDRFAALLEERSDGRMQVSVFPNSTLGGNRELLEQLQMGTLEMASPSAAALGGFTDGTALFDLPYLFDSPESAFAVFDSEVGRDMLDQLEASSLVGLDWYAMGWRQLSANRPIRTPEDMAGLRIRVQENQMHIDHFNSLGASATPMAFAEVYTSLQQGVIDAQENPISQIYSQRFYEVQDYIIETRHIFDPVPLVMSHTWWNSLNAADQTLIREVSREVVAWQREIIEDIDSALTHRLADRVSIIELSDSERAAFRAAVQPMWETHTSHIGAEVLARVAEIQASVN